MIWNAAPLRLVAPPRASQLSISDDNVWLLSLDQIESGTGCVVKKRYSNAKTAGTSTFAFDEGNVLYSKLRPYLNKVVVPDELGFATTELVPLRPDPKIITRRYLAYYLRSAAFVNQASHFVSGAKMPRVVMEWFWAHEVPLPPLKEQHQIVELLDEAEVLNKLRSNADAKFARILPALYTQMFGSPENNPRGLRKEPLGKLLKIKSGDFLAAKDMVETGTFPVYGGNGVSGFHDCYMFQDRKIVIGRVGAYCGAVHYSEPNAWITDNALYVSEMFEPLDDLYLITALELANLNQYAGRAGQPLVSGSRIYPVEILVPFEADQTTFSRLASDIIKTKLECDAARDRVNILWEVLLQQAFSGHLTAKWRSENMKDIIAEIAEQSSLLSVLASETLAS